jgi:hypothetical protein
MDQAKQRIFLCYKDARCSRRFEFHRQLIGIRLMKTSSVVRLYLNYLWTRCSRLMAILGTALVHAPLQHIQGNVNHA